MTAKIFIVVFLLLLASVLEARSSDEIEYATESLTKKELQEMVSEFLKKRNHEYKRRHRHDGACGAKAVRKIGKLCPSFCNIVDETLLIELCTNHLEDKEIVDRCCP